MTKTTTKLLTLLALTGCGAAEPTVEPTATEQAITATSEAMGVVGTIGQAAQDVAAATSEQAAQGDDAPTGDAPEGALAGRACVSLEWSLLDPLHLAVVLDECISSVGQIVDGRIDGWLQYGGVPGSVGLGLDRLTVDSVSVTGLLVGTTTEGHGTRFQLDADLADSATGFAIGIEGGVLENEDGVVTLAGAGSVADGGRALDLTILDALRWDDPGTCYPTTGRFRLAEAGQAPVEATFVTTPTGSAVDVQILPAPAAPIRVALPPCGGALTE